jgi:hypothetical protein
VSAFHDDLGCLRAWDRPIQAFCTPIMIAPCTRRQRFIRTARRYRSIEIQAGPPIIAEALPDELRHAIETIVRAADLRTNLAQLGAAIRCCTAAFKLRLVVRRSEVPDCSRPATRGPHDLYRRRARRGLHCPHVGHLVTLRVAPSAQVQLLRAANQEVSAS